MAPVILPSLPPVGDPDFSERLSSRRRPKKKYHRAKAAMAPTPARAPITIPAIAPPLKDEPLPLLDDEALDVEVGSETVIVTT